MLVYKPYPRYFISLSRFCISFALALALGWGARWILSISIGDNNGLLIILQLIFIFNEIEYDNS